MSDRRMVYPYTITAKALNFPYKFYWNNSPYYKFYIVAVVLCFPFFYKIQQLSCSEANYVKLAEYRAKEKLEIRHHQEHLL